MKIFKNPYRGTGLTCAELSATPMPSVDVAPARAIWAERGMDQVTPLEPAPTLAAQAGVAELWIKREDQRMGLGAFKALGAAYVIAREAEAGDVSGKTYVTASAGNHGMSVAFGARLFGARSVIFLAETVPAVFVDRLRGQGAEVVIEGADYDASLRAALRYASDNGYELLPDATGAWPEERPFRVMEGYTVLMAEIDEQMQAPTHVFLQAGVGGLAGAAAAYGRHIWGDAPVMVVVEPEFGQPLMGSIKAGKPVQVPGPVSVMGRLDCKEPSTVALKGLARDADVFATISEAQSKDGADQAAAAGFPSTPSGAAGIAALLYSSAHRTQLGLDETSRVLCILSEAPE